MKKKFLLTVSISLIFLSTTSFSQNINNEPSDLKQVTEEKPLKSSTLSYLKSMDEPIHTLEDSWIRLFTAPTTMTSTEITYVLTSTAVIVGALFIFYKSIKSIFTRDVTNFEKKNTAIQYLLSRSIINYQDATNFLFKNTITHNVHNALWQNKENNYVKFLIGCNPNIVSDSPSQSNSVIDYHAHQE